MRWRCGGPEHQLVTNKYRSIYILYSQVEPTSWVFVLPVEMACLSSPCVTLMTFPCSSDLHLSVLFTSLFSNVGCFHWLLNDKFPPCLSPERIHIQMSSQSVACRALRLLLPLHGFGSVALTPCINKELKLTYPKCFEIFRWLLGTKYKKRTFKFKFF